MIGFARVVRSRTIQTLALLAVIPSSRTAAETSRRERSAKSQPPVYLVASCERTSGKNNVANTWLVDNRGRQFTLSEEIAIALGDNIKSGNLTSSAVASIIKFAQPVGRTVLPAELEHALTLVVGAQRSTLWNHEQLKRCKDGGSDIYRAYVLSPGKASQEPVLLRSRECGRIVDENASPAARELVTWIDSLSRPSPSPSK